MENFTKDIYMKGCHLVARLYGDTQNMYQFVFNPETAEFSDIYAYETGLEFEIEEDGTYNIVTIQSDSATLVDGSLQYGDRVLSAENIVDAINSNVVNIGTYDMDSTLSICKLKKCLAQLELKIFQERLKNCGSIKCKNDEVKSQRDFLFIAVWLMERYIELGNIEKAQAIYNSLKGCGNLCKDLINNNKNCGCNG